MLQDGLPFHNIDCFIEQPLYWSDKFLQSAKKIGSCLDNQPLLLVP